jgi:hypothetical protein
MLAVQAMIDAQRPGLEVGKDAVSPGQHDMSGHFAYRMGIVVDARGARVTRPAVRLGRGAGDWRPSNRSLLTTSAAAGRGIILAWVAIR